MRGTWADSLGSRASRQGVLEGSGEAWHQAVRGCLEVGQPEEPQSDLGCCRWHLKWSEERASSTWGHGASNTPPGGCPWFQAITAEKSLPGDWVPGLGTCRRVWQPPSQPHHACPSLPRAGSRSANAGRGQLAQHGILRPLHSSLSWARPLLFLQRDAGLRLSPVSWGMAVKCLYRSWSHKREPSGGH